MLQNLGLLDFLFSLLHHVLKSDTMSADVNPRWVGVVSMRGMFFALSDGSNPVTYAYKKMMREMTLSVFVDESGIWNESDASSRFSRVKVYYDCGQTYITHLLHKGFDELKIPIVEFAQSVKPRHYKLFQVADLICTLRLLAAKLETEGRLSPSEFRFFGGIKAFKHNVLRRIKPKEI